MDMPKCFTLWVPRILCEGKKQNKNDLENFSAQWESCKNNVIDFDVCHLWEGEANAPHAFAMEYIDAAMTIILQRGPNGQIIEAIGIDIGQYSKRGAKPPLLIFVPSQHYWRVRRAVNILTGAKGQELVFALPV